MLSKYGKKTKIIFTLLNPELEKDANSRERIARKLRFTSHKKFEVFKNCDIFSKNYKPRKEKKRLFNQNANKIKFIYQCLSKSDSQEGKNAAYKIRFKPSHQETPPCTKYDPKFAYTRQGILNVVEYDKSIKSTSSRKKPEIGSQKFYLSHDSFDNESNSSRNFIEMKKMMTRDMCESHNRIRYHTESSSLNTSMINATINTNTIRNTRPTEPDSTVGKAHKKTSERSYEGLNTISSFPKIKQKDSLHIKIPGLDFTKNISRDRFEQILTSHRTIGPSYFPKIDTMFPRVPSFVNYQCRLSVKKPLKSNSFRDWIKVYSQMQSQSERLYCPSETKMKSRSFKKMFGRSEKESKLPSFMFNIHNGFIKDTISAESLEMNKYRNSDMKFKGESLIKKSFNTKQGAKNIMKNRKNSEEGHEKLFKFLCKDPKRYKKIISYVKKNANYYSRHLELYRNTASVELKK